MKNKYFYLMLLVCSLTISACTSSNNTVVVQDKPKVEINPETALGNTFVDALKTKNFELLKDYFPTVSIAKSLAPNETEGLGDEEIKNQMLNPLKEKLKINFDNIGEALEKNEVSLEKLALVSAVEATDTEDNPEGIKVLTVTIGDGTKQGGFPVTLYKQDTDLYWFEILLSTNIQFK